MCDRPFIARSRSFDGTGLVRKSSAPALMPYSDRDVGIAGEENDRQRRTEFAQALLKFRTTQSRYPHVEENAARDAFLVGDLRTARARASLTDYRGTT